MWTTPDIRLGMAPKTKPKRERQRHYLAEWRKFRGLTQERAADRIGKTQAALSRYERGLTPYDQDILELLAEAYQTDPGSLLMRNPMVKDAPWSIENKLKGIPAAELDVLEGAIDGMIARLHKAG